MAALFLLIDFRSYWLHTSGRGGGADLDALLVRDPDGFPALSAKHVQGVLREASRRAEAWGWPQTLGYLPSASEISRGDFTDVLFGGRGGDAAPGCLEFDDFRLPPDLRETATAWAWSRPIASTRIEEGTRAARDKTLRSIEAAVPCVLGGPVTWDDKRRLVERPQDASLVAEVEKVWRRHIDAAILEVRALGAKRTRGFGRCFVTRHDVSAGGRA
jgi:hypothetical protein